jgi:hypothetical protein
MFNISEAEACGARQPRNKTIESVSTAGTRIDRETAGKPNSWHVRNFQLRQLFARSRVVCLAALVTFVA